MLAVVVCPLLKADSLILFGTVTMFQREARANIAGIVLLDVVHESGICQMNMKKIRMGLSLMGTP